MALTKEISYDYEIRGVGNNIQQRQRIILDYVSVFHFYRYRNSSIHQCKAI